MCIRDRIVSDPSKATLESSGEYVEATDVIPPTASSTETNKDHVTKNIVTQETPNPVEQITSQDEQPPTSTENTETYNQDNKKEIDDKLNTPENKKINDWLQKNDKPDNKLLHLLYKNPEYMKYVKLLAQKIPSRAVLNTMKRDRGDWGDNDSFIQDYMTAMR